MAALLETLHFTNRAGEVAAHPAGYATLRHRPGRREPTDLPALLTALDDLLLRRGWTRFLADYRVITPLTADEKEWFVAQWLGRWATRRECLTGYLVLPHEVVARLSLLEMFALADKATLTYLPLTDLAQAEAQLRALAPPAAARRQRPGPRR